MLSEQQRENRRKMNRSFWVGEHIEVLGKWCAQRGHGSSTPHPQYFALPSFLAIPELYPL